MDTYENDLWKECGFSGSKEAQNFRETICNLIRYHLVPLHILEQTNPEHRLRKIMANGALAGDFSLKMLFVLVEADIKGRIAASKEDSLETLELCKEMAKENSFRVECNQSDTTEQEETVQFVSGIQCFRANCIFRDRMGKRIKKKSGKKSYSP